MQILKFITLILWLAIGLYDLTKEKAVSKTDYALMWAMVLLYSIKNLLP
jgi:hypothetical protein